MNRRLVVSILAMILVLTMILSLVLTVIPVRADGVEQASAHEASETVQQCIAENNSRKQYLIEYELDWRPCGCQSNVLFS